MFGFGAKVVETKVNEMDTLRKLADARFQEVKSSIYNISNKMELAVQPKKILEKSLSMYDTPAFLVDKEENVLYVNEKFIKRVPYITKLERLSQLSPNLTLKLENKSKSIKVFDEWMLISCSKTICNENPYYIFLIHEY